MPFDLGGRHPTTLTAALTGSPKIYRRKACGFAPPAIAEGDGGPAWTKTRNENSKPLYRSDPFILPSLLRSAPELRLAGQSGRAGQLSEDGRAEARRPTHLHTQPRRRSLLIFPIHPTNHHRPSHPNSPKGMDPPHMAPARRTTALMALLLFATPGFGVGRGRGLTRIPCAALAVTSRDVRQG